jgi:hypothetical protein
MFFVRVANKGLIAQECVRVAGIGLKGVCFESVTGYLVRVAKKGLRVLEERGRKRG